MDVNSSIITILFKDINIDYLINKMLADNVSSKLCDKNVFMEFMSRQLPFYSLSELNNIYNQFNIKIENRFELGINEKLRSIYNLILSKANDFIQEENGDPICKSSYLLEWRTLTHKIDQDIFISAYYAYRDTVAARKREVFDWDIVIKSNNYRIHNMLKKGVAENHFHLKGSAPYFYLTWISLMNNVKKRDNQFKESKINYQRMDSYKEFNMNFQSLIYKAAYLRLKLYEAVMFEAYEKKKNDILNDMNIEDKNKLQCEIDSLKYFSKIDYAIGKDNNICDNYISIYSGERKLIYKCFEKIYTNDKNFEKYQDLFYLYLVIKTKFRAELVQVNDMTGFKNFSEYQSRKEIFLQNDKRLSREIITSAMLSSIKDQNVVSLEARIVPKIKVKDIVKQIKFMDKNIAEEIIKDNDNFWVKNSDFDKHISFKVDKDKYYNNIYDKYFYVFHYPKRSDNNFKKNNFINNFIPRHDQMRRYLKKQSYNLLKLRNELYVQANRIMGIDGCGDELICRPEVFAHSFRFMKNHFSNNDNMLKRDQLPKLKITYHVGEDFLDIADGLRAVDEALTFFEMEQGDRIGHGLVLAIDVDYWYEFKHDTINLTKHDILDNLAWMIAKTKELNLKDSHEILNYLEPLFDKYFMDIYGAKWGRYDDALINGVNSNIYYLAWTLRGDNPDLYINGDVRHPNKLLYWDRCSLRNLDDPNIRNNKIITKLYYLYHYDSNVKFYGSAEECFKVSSIYIKAVKQIQKYMQIKVCEKGIGIETNPSSNYLIGNFRRYDNHPIINMYNNNLILDYEKLNECNQMFVSINTDDQGVFGTLLENEYALMATALETATDEFGNRMYKKNMIYRWLDDIRNMGIEQSFSYRGYNND